jgi:hypothetical protein
MPRPDSTVAGCSISPTAVQVGTLLVFKTSPATNVGQFTAPFYITIRRQ